MLIYLMKPSESILYQFHFKSHKLKLSVSNGTIFSVNSIILTETITFRIVEPVIPGFYVEKNLEHTELTNSQSKFSLSPGYFQLLFYINRFPVVIFRLLIHSTPRLSRDYLWLKPDLSAWLPICPASSKFQY